MFISVKLICVDIVLSLYIISLGLCLNRVAIQLLPDSLNILSPHL